MSSNINASTSAGLVQTADTSGVLQLQCANAPVATFTNAGSATPLAGAVNPTIALTGSANNYIQAYLFNGTSGANASADITVYPNNGLDSSGWMDMGITSQTYSQAVYSVTGANEGYLFMSAPAGSSTSGNMVLATDSTGSSNSIEFYTNGFNQGKTAPKLRINGTTGIITAAAGNVMLVRGNEVTASGTAVDFTGIPSWVKRITVMFNGVSTNGSSNIIIQLGDSGGIETTGYLSIPVSSGAGGNAVSNITTGIGLTATNAAGYILAGACVITNITGNAWVAQGNFYQTTTQASSGNGSKTLSAVLDRIRITTVNGTDTFDAGTINIMYE